MNAALPEYCDLSLPVPLDRNFTYAMPLSVRHRAQVGCRVIVPFSRRKLMGVIVALHGQKPPGECKEVLRLVDEAPVFDAEMMALASWVSEYYCAPMGEVLRGMAPLTGESRKGVVYSLTQDGRDLIRQSVLGLATEGPAERLMRLLDERPQNETWLKQRVPGASVQLSKLLKKGLVEREEFHVQKDPLRMASERLLVEGLQPPPPLELDGKKLPKAERELLSFLALHPGEYALNELEDIVKNASSAARSLARKGLLRTRPRPTVHGGIGSGTRHPLNEQQQSALDAITRALDVGEFRAFLLQGVTGSGKTEVYMHAIEAVLAKRRNALMLVPEIALTPAMAGHFYHRFGDKVAILHSAFHDAERASQWRRVQSGEAGVVVATRSGVFAPIPNLGLILVDEEHDGSYKQEETPRYHGRDVAVYRASMHKAVVVLGSATPSLETRYNAELGKYQRLLLPERVNGRPMPEVDIIDMRQEFLETHSKDPFSRRMAEAVTERLEKHEQVMVLHNRRGFSTQVVCRSCGYAAGCPHCAVTLTYHRRHKRMLCHYCGYAEAVPKVCVQCASEHLHFVGAGSEKIEDFLHQYFPGARIARMDRDTVGGKRGYETILEGFRDGAYDILVGTQMIAKGHDIPNVTLVCVVTADAALALPDFRAAERTFQLLTQVAGRAGRGFTPGRVLVQTLHPEHYSVTLAATQDYEAFYATEIAFRRQLRYPPYAFLANVLLRHEKQEEAMRMATEVKWLLDPPSEQIRVMGPAEAPVPKLKSEFRYQILLKSASRAALRRTILRIREHAASMQWRATSVVLDVDPLNLM
ncbi:MAG: primosomal protein N' [Bryobacterales bacterium]|nr:primosomal protein N' [Bryobacterales bacterium]